MTASGRVESSRGTGQTGSGALPPLPDRYEVRGLLGRGGMGAVYEVYDRRRERVMAMKVLRDPERGSLYRFKREFRAAADLLHPNLVRLFDLGVLPDGTFFFTMELLRGLDLAAWAASRRDGEATTAAGDGALTRLRGLGEAAGDAVRASEFEAASPGSNSVAAATTPGRATPMEARASTPGLNEALCGVLRGLAFLHRARKVHRDLKPSNILVDSSGIPKILDFGILRELDAPAGVTALRGALGTPLYMAPEQVSGSGTVGPAADLYAFGCLLYELLAGAPPFTGPSVRVMVQHLTETPRPPSQQRPCEPALEALCLELLHKDATARPTAQAALARLGGGSAPSAPLHVAPELVGRTSELGALEQALGEAATGPRIVLLRGESGVGKSALATELALLAQARGSAAWFGRCYEREQVPYKAFDALIDTLAATLARRGEAAHHLLPEGSASLARLFPVLREVDAITSLPAETTLRDAQAERRRATRALFTLLTNLSPGGPPVCIIDDWQWADAESVEVLRWLAWAKEAPPCLLLITERPEPESGPVQNALGGPAERLTRLELSPLDDAAVERLVEAVASRTLSVQERSQLAAEARGNPFLALELGRAVAEKAGTETLPTLESLVERRLESVGADARLVLEAAAIAGGRARFPLLRAATELGEAALAEAVDELLREGLLREGAGDGDESYDLAHDRFREAAYRGVAQERRRELHRRMAAWLAEHGDTARAAAQWRRADEPERARAAALAAARAAEAQLAFDRAGTLYALAEGEVPSAELSFARAAALSKAGRHHEAAAALEAGIPYASPGAAREAALQTAIELVAAGEMQRGVAAFEALLGRFGEKLRPRSTRALVAFSLLWLVCTWFFRDLLRLRECHPPREAPDDYFRLQLYDAIGHHLLIIDPLVAARFGVKHTRLARRLGQQAHVGRARIAHATRIAAVFGQWGRRRAYLHLDRGEALCAEAGDARGLLDGLFARGIIHLHEGNVTGLRRIAAEAETLARERGLFEDPTLMMLRNIHLGGEYFAGDLPGTVERAEAYLREARLRANALELGEATQILGLAKLMMGDGPSGRAYLEEALTLIPEKPLILARLRLELSAVELCLFLGDYPRGRERLALTKAHRRKVGAGLSGLDRALLAVQEGRLELAARGPGEPLPGSFGGLRLRILANIAPPVLRPVMRRFSAAVHYRRGDTKGALRELDESLRFSEHCNNLLGAGMALAARATVRRAAGLDGADLDARRASELLRSLGASGCYLLRAEGWADPDAGPGVQKR